MYWYSFSVFFLSYYAVFSLSSYHDDFCFTGGRS
jgi:hypothetical protein